MIETTIAMMMSAALVAPGQCTVDLDCNDLVSCTVDTCINPGPSGVCSNVATNSLCDNGLFCDGVERCNALLDCQAGTPVNCADAVGCTVDSCDEVNNICVNTPTDTLCSNGVFCDGAETCDAVLDCQAGGNPCPGLLCDELGTACVECFVDLDCDDGLFCNGVETCLAGVCQAGAAVDCADLVGCTVDSCDEVNNVCVSTPADTLCSNGVFCDGAETCDPLLGCQVATPLTCNDGIGCTADSCDEVNDQCVNAPNDALCQDTSFCNGLEVCDPVLNCRLGTPVNCDDGQACTTLDLCDEINDTCIHVVNNGLCDDGLFCTGVEVCTPVIGCESPNPPLCADGVPCTDDLCDAITDACANPPNNVNCDNGVFCDGAETCDPVLDCQPGSGACPVLCDELNDVCVECFVDLDCDDGLFCNGVETCLAGVCQSGTPIDCTDGVGCTLDVCDEPTNTCTNPPADLLCDNGVFCDGAETCDALLGCQVATPLTCDDAIACTNDSCDEVNDVCVNAPVDALCDNLVFCDGAETCVAGVGCQNGPIPLCDDLVACTVDSCDLLNDVCANVATDSLCDNGQFCDGVETCDALAGCVFGTPVNCVDAAACTVDSCDEVADVCLNVPDATVCDNAVFCDGAEICDPVLDCIAGPLACDDGVNCTVDTCDEIGITCTHTPIPGCQNCLLDIQCNDGIGCTVDTCVAGDCVNTPNDALCENGLFCDGVEVCSPVFDCRPGSPVDCTDGVACTVDGCDETDDVCLHTPNDSLCNNTQFCDGIEACDGILGCRSGGNPCDDGVSCTADACNELTDTCIPVPIDDACNNGVFCDGVELCHPLFDCEAGTPACDDGVACTFDSCNETVESCNSVPVNGLCDDGDELNGIEVCDPGQGCLPGDPPDLVHVVPVVLRAPSGLDVSMGGPPASDSEVDEAAPFVIEIWAQQPFESQDPPLNGLCCVFADLDFNNGIMTCANVTPAPDYSLFWTGTCGAGQVDEVGGCTFITGLGITPEWVRIATVSMTGDVAGAENVVSTAPASTGNAICQHGSVSVQQTLYDSSGPFTVGTPCIYDLDGSGCITPGDLAFFAPCWTLSSADPEWGPFSCSRSDFDCSGSVNPGDLSFFATAWLKCCDDPAIVFPPLPCGTASGQALPPASRKVVESFGLPYPDDTGLQSRQLLGESKTDRDKPDAVLKEEEKRFEGMPLNVRERPVSRSPGGRSEDKVGASGIDHFGSSLENHDR